jgi:uncharacterized protein YqiB (DUF1249 family)
MVVEENAKRSASRYTTVVQVTKTLPTSPGAEPAVTTPVLHDTLTQTAVVGHIAFDYV